jgi:hypothetical protein
MWEMSLREDGNLHRLVGRRDLEHFTRDVVLADDEIGWPEIENGGAGVVEDADEHRALNRLRGESRRGRRSGQEEPQGDTGAETGLHHLSIGPKEFEMCDLREIARAHRRVV